MKRRRTKTQVWGAPVLLGLISAIGLGAALVSDGVGDVVSWLTLAAPIIVIVWFIIRPAHAKSKQR